jgi:hypothetical protein
MTMPVVIRGPQVLSHRGTTIGNNPLPGPSPGMLGIIERRTSMGEGLPTQGLPPSLQSWSVARYRGSSSGSELKTVCVLCTECVVWRSRKEAFAVANAFLLPGLSSLESQRRLDGRSAKTAYVCPRHSEDRSLETPRQYRDS